MKEYTIETKSPYLLSLLFLLLGGYALVDTLALNSHLAATTTVKSSTDNRYSQPDWYRSILEGDTGGELSPQDSVSLSDAETQQRTKFQRLVSYYQLLVMIATVCVFLLISQTMKSFKRSHVLKLLISQQLITKVTEEELLQLSDRELLCLLQEVMLTAELDKKKAQESQRLNQQFLINMSHEFRTPLSVVKGVAEGLKSGVISKEFLPRSLTLLIGSTEELARLVDQSLTLFGESDSLVISYFSMRALIHQVVAELQLSQRLTIIRIDEKDCWVWLDKGKLHHLLTCLITNAWEFTEKGTIAIHYGITEHILKIRVEDTGIGIPKHEQHNIFQPFYKVDPSRQKSQYSQFGLGLCQVQKIVSAHQGTIEVSSTLGEGTIIIVELPSEKIKQG